MNIQPINFSQNYVTRIQRTQKTTPSFKGIEDSMDAYDRARGQQASEIELRKEALSREAHKEILNGNHQKAADIKKEIRKICASQDKWDDVKKLTEGIEKLEKEAIRRLR